MPFRPGDFPDELFGSQPEDPHADPWEAEPAEAEPLEAEPLEPAPPPQENAALLAATKELRQIQAALVQCRAKGDVALARRLRDRWNKLTTIWGMEVDDQIIAGAEPALRWLRQQEKQQAAAAAEAAARQAAEPAEKSPELLQALEELERLQAGLEQARKDSNLDQGRQLRTRWNELTTIWGMEVDDALTARAKPALDWLHEQDGREERHAAAVVALDLAVDAQEPLERIRPLYREAVRGGKLPPELLSRYRRYVKTLEKAVVKRNRLVIAGTVVCVLLIVGMIAGLVVYKQHRSRITAAVEKVNGLLAEWDLKSAQEYLDELQAEQPRVAADPRLRDQQRQIKELSAAEAKRRQDFTQVLERLQDSLANGRPDAEGLVEAAQLARKAPTPQLREEDVAAIKKLQQEFASTGAKGQEALDEQLRKQLKPFAEQLEQLEAACQKDWLGNRAKVAQARTELRKIETDNPTVSQAGRDEIQPLWTRLRKLEQGAEGAAQQQSWERQLALACGDIDKFRKGLQAYADKFPDSPRAAAFRQVIEESRLWQAMFQWNTLVKAVRHLDFSRIRRQTAAECLEQLKKPLADYPDHPDAAEFRRRMPYLEAVARRDAGGKPTEEPLKALFTGPLMTEAWMLVDTQGRRYYFKEDPKFRADDPKAPELRGLKYIGGADGTTMQRTFTKNEVVKVVAAPQTALCAEVNKAMNALGDGQWEVVFVSIISVIARDTQTDPLLRLNLLRQIVPVVCAGSLPLSRLLAPNVEVLQQAKADAAANWVDPDDEAGRAASKQAAIDLAAFPDVSTVAQAATGELTSLHPKIGTEYQWIGWLEQPEEGVWRCVSESPPAMFGTLVVLRPAGAKTAIEPVGLLKHANPAIEAKKGPGLVEGRPVFLVVSPEK
jgi:hypothetical protein